MKGRCLHLSISDRKFLSVCHHCKIINGSVQSWEVRVEMDVSVKENGECGTGSRNSMLVMLKSDIRCCSRTGQLLSKY